MINLHVYCRQLNKLNAAVKEKRPELVNRKGVIFHDDNSTPHTSLATRQKLLRLGWAIWCYIHHIVLTLHHQISIYFDLCRTPWMVKLSMIIKLWNRTWFSFLPIKTRSSMGVESWSYQKDGKRSLNKIEIISLLKVHSLYLKKCV